MAFVKLPFSLHQFSDLPWADNIYVLASISGPWAVGRVTMPFNSIGNRIKTECATFISTLNYCMSTVF